MSNITTLPAPEPLSAPDCDLRGYEFMPLFGDRLMESDFFAESSDLEFRAAIRVWWASWKQVPAGSLPNKDVILCRLAGFETNLRRWAKVKERVLHGFTLCSDGRLYHPFICELAATAFEKRRKERERKANQRAGHNQTQPVENIENHPPLSRGTVTGQSAGQPEDVPCDRTGQDRTGEDTTEKEPNGSAVQPAVAELSVQQQSDQLAASAEVTAPPAPRIEDTRHLMPRASDPPFKWIGSGLSPGLDGKPITGLDKQGTAHLLAGKVGVNRIMLDYAARAVCDAARIDHTWRGDWWVLVGWLTDGFELDKHIVAAITALVARKVKTEKGYTRPSTLRYFDAAIREYIEAHREAA